VRSAPTAARKCSRVVPPRRGSSSPCSWRNRATHTALYAAVEHVSAVETSIKGFVKASRAYLAAMCSHAASNAFSVVELVVKDGEEGPDASRAHYLAFRQAHDSVTDKETKLRDNFDKAVIGFLTRWQQLIDAAKTSKTEFDSKKLERDHYRVKLQSLREAQTAAMAKGKAFDSALASKITRNEGKLEESEREFSTARDAYLTTSHRVWASRAGLRDSLLLRLMQFEMELAKSTLDASKAYEAHISTLLEQHVARGDGGFGMSHLGRFEQGKLVAGSEAPASEEAPPLAYDEFVAPPAPSAPSNDGFDDWGGAPSAPVPSAPVSKPPAAPVAPSNDGFDDWGGAPSAPVPSAPVSKPPAAPVAPSNDGFDDWGGAPSAPVPSAPVPSAPVSKPPAAPVAPSNDGFDDWGGTPSAPVSAVPETLDLGLDSKDVSSTGKISIALKGGSKPRSTTRASTTVTSGSGLALPVRKPTPQPSTSTPVASGDLFSEDLFAPPAQTQPAPTEHFTPSKAASTLSKPAPSSNVDPFWDTPALPPTAAPIAAPAPAKQGWSDPFASVSAPAPGQPAHESSDPFGDFD
jgi:hypothetical protein